MSPLETAATTEAMQWLVLLLSWLGALVVGGAVINVIRWWRS
jgi:hypothetical protein